MKLLKLNGKKAVGEWKYAQVDDEDFEWLNQYKWYIYSSNKSGKYKCYKDHINIWRHEKDKKILLHRMIMNFPPCNVDHEDRNRLNNQKINLRLATHRQNCCNRDSKFGSTSKYLGVSLVSKSGKWQSALRVNGKKIHLGLFNDEVKAAEVYDIYALIYHEGFANLNFSNKLEDYKIRMNNLEKEKPRIYSSNYFGVSLHKKHNRFLVKITKDKTRFHLGSFVNEVAAAETSDLFNIKNGINLNKINFPEKIDYYKEILQNENKSIS